MRVGCWVAVAVCGLGLSVAEGRRARGAEASCAKALARSESVPQRLKPLCQGETYGTTEVVPLSETASWAGVGTLDAEVPGQGDPGTPPKVATQSAKAPDDGSKKDIIMTKAQEKALLASVDEIMAFVSQDTGLPPVEKVKRRLVSRDEVSKYLVKSFNEDESAKKLERSEIVLKKFGLLDRSFDLKPFLLSLLTEQIAGYYDAKTKVVNLLNWVEPDEQKPVMAHELTHAVQDQKVGLEKWSDSGFKGISKTASEDSARIAVDELETARQAVTEGQAMVTFVDWTLKPVGKTLLDAPEIVKGMRESGGDSSGGSPIMARAPLLLQRSLEFPYTDGLGFEQALLVKGGKKLAFAAVLDDPPNSSFQVMHPEAYLAHAPVPVLRLPDVHAPLDAEYEPYDVGVMGELDVEIMASLFGGPELGHALAQAWDGGVYYAGQRRAASAAEKATTGSLGVLYFSKWKGEEAAETFEKLYTAELGRKYSKLRERKGDEAEGEQVYSSEEGDVLLSRTDDALFVSEGFPLATARKLREATTSVQGTGPVKLAGVQAGMPELALGAMAGAARFGVLRATMTSERYTAEQR